MSWAVGYDERWQRDIGYGVPAYCDYPGCEQEINRGLAYVCCRDRPYGGEHGCGRYYCRRHEMLTWEAPDCEDEDGDEPRCAHPDDAHVSPDHPDWMRHKLTDESWQPWRDENPEMVAALKKALIDASPTETTENCPAAAPQPRNSASETDQSNEK